MKNMLATGSIYTLLSSVNICFLTGIAIADVLIIEAAAEDCSHPGCVSLSQGSFVSYILKESILLYSTLIRGSLLYRLCHRRCFYPCSSTPGWHVIQDEIRLHDQYVSYRIDVYSTLIHYFLLDIADVLLYRPINRRGLILAPARVG